MINNFNESICNNEKVEDDDFNAIKDWNVDSRESMLPEDKACVADGFGCETGIILDTLDEFRSSLQITIPIQSPSNLIEPSQNNNNNNCSNNSTLLPLVKPTPRNVLTVPRSVDLGAFEVIRSTDINTDNGSSLSKALSSNTLSLSKPMPYNFPNILPIKNNKPITSNSINNKNSKHENDKPVKMDNYQNLGKGINYKNNRHIDWRPPMTWSIRMVNLIAGISEEEYYEILQREKRRHDKLERKKNKSSKKLSKNNKSSHKHHKHANHSKHSIQSKHSVNSVNSLNSSVSMEDEEEGGLEMYGSPNNDSNNNNNNVIVNEDVSLELSLNDLSVIKNKAKLANNKNNNNKHVKHNNKYKYGDINGSVDESSSISNSINSHKISRRQIDHSHNSRKHNYNNGQFEETMSNNGSVTSNTNSNAYSNAYSNVGRRKFDGMIEGKPRINDSFLYVLAYAAMLGIRITSGLPPPSGEIIGFDYGDNQYREINDDDYNHSISISLPQYRAVAKLKFKTYMNDVFRFIRGMSGISELDYLMSIACDFNSIDFIANTSTSPGQFFFYSHDGRHLVKSLAKAEAKLLRKIMKPYSQYLHTNPNSLLTKYHGLYRVDVGSLSIYLVVMASVLPADVPTHMKFDLKGSGDPRRWTKPPAVAAGVVQRDVNILESRTCFKLDSVKAAMVAKTLAMDAAFLEGLNIVGYSFLVGIYKIGSGNQGRRHAGVSIANTSQINTAYFSSKSTNPSPNISNPNLNSNPSLSPAYVNNNRFVAASGDEIYYFGVIDFLKEFNLMRKIKSLLRRFASCSSDSSDQVPPSTYSRNFTAFMTARIETVINNDETAVAAFSSPTQSINKTLRRQSQSLAPSQSQSITLTQDHLTPDETDKPLNTDNNPNPNPNVSRRRSVAEMVHAGNDNRSNDIHTVKQNRLSLSNRSSRMIPSSSSSSTTLTLTPDNNNENNNNNINIGNNNNRHSVRKGINNNNNPNPNPNQPQSIINFNTNNIEKKENINNIDLSNGNMPLLSIPPTTKLKLEELKEKTKRLSVTLQLPVSPEPEPETGTTLNNNISNAYSYSTGNSAPDIGHFKSNLSSILLNSRRMANDFVPFDSP